MTVTIRAVQDSDYAAWLDCYRGYYEFYGRTPVAEGFATVWGWLHDDVHEVRGLVAEVDGKVMGIAHYRTFARPLAASTGIYLDDLFTLPGARGHGVGTALLARLQEIARDEGASVVRWITAEDNATARSMYDRVATATPWVTYDLAPAE